MRIVLVGSGHVFELGDAIRGLVATERPGVVALELDPRRYQGLLERRAGRVPSKADAKRAPRIYRYLAKYQESIAEAFGAQPGMEMLAAAEAAQTMGARIALIDRDAEAVVRDAIKRMPWRERLRFVWTAVRGLLVREKQPAFEAEIARYQNDPNSYLEELGRDFPTIRKVLIDERNAHMAAQLRQIATTTPTVVAVVGDGHVPGLQSLLSDVAPVVHRLKDLRRYKPSLSPLEWRASSGQDQIGFSFSGQSLEDAWRRD